MTLILLQKPRPLQMLIHLCKGLNAAKTWLLAIGFALSLTLNVASVLFDSVYQGLSSVVEAVGAGLPKTWRHTTVRQRQAVQRLQLKRQAKAISTKLQRRVMRAAVRTPAVSVAEAVPLIGISVVIADTTLTLYEACESMKDFASLERILGIADATQVQQNTVCGLQAPTQAEIWQALQEAPASAWNAARGALENAQAADNVSDKMLDIPSWDAIYERSAVIFDHVLNWTRSSLE